MMSTFAAIGLAQAPPPAATAPPVGSSEVPGVALNIVNVESPEKTAKPARAVTLEDTSAVPDDFWAQSEYGDLMLQNDFANFVFGRIPKDRNPNERLRPGSVIDIFTSPSAPENFQVFKPTIQPGQGNPTLYATDMDSTVDEKKGSATVTVLAEDAITTETSVDTTYEMQKGWPGVLVTTTVTN
ncbi:MAG TPA: hypothetical protein PKD58_12470, partial [Candidatus Sumerlaeota bacterium]|nr:hypothetical protein [Candidatus Sumerlaeota bacterium]